MLKWPSSKNEWSFSYPPPFFFKIRTDCQTWLLIKYNPKWLSSEIIIIYISYQPLVTHSQAIEGVHESYVLRAWALEVDAWWGCLWTTGRVEKGRFRIRLWAIMGSMKFILNERCWVCYTVWISKGDLKKVIVGLDSRYIYSLIFLSYYSMGRVDFCHFSPAVRMTPDRAARCLPDI